MRLPIGTTWSLADRPGWFRAAVRAHDALTWHTPRVGLAAAHALGAVSSGLRLYGPSAAAIDRLPGPRGARRSLARAITSRDLVSRAFDRLLLQGGWERLAHLVALGRADSLVEAARDGRPLIVGVLHGGGPVAGVSVALQQLGVQALIVRATAGSGRPSSIEAAATRADGSEAALVLRRAVDRLRSGRWVVIALDGLGTCCPPVGCHGLAVRFARGAFALSRMCGVPIVPVVSRWRGGRIPVEVLSFDPIPPQPAAAGVAGERDQAEAVARWLEGRLRTHPEEMSLLLLHQVDRRGRAAVADSRGG